MKDVLTLNEISWLNDVGAGLNDWLLAHEDAGYNDGDGKGLKIRAVLLTVTDADDHPFGSFTKYTGEDDVKFEPDYVPVEVAAE